MKHPEPCRWLTYKGALDLLPEDPRDLLTAEELRQLDTDLAELAELRRRVRLTEGWV